MRNNKFKHAQFNLTLQRVVQDNWRFLAGVCLVLESEYGWKRKRLEAWVESAAEYVKLYNEYDDADIYRGKLEAMERDVGGGIITYQRVELIVFKNTTLGSPAYVSEIVDNLLLELLMTAREFDDIGRERLIAGLEALSREDFDKAPETLKERHGVELDTGFNDYYGLIKKRHGRGKETFAELKAAKAGLEAFRRWSDINNPG